MRLWLMELLGTTIPLVGNATTYEVDHDGSRVPCQASRMKDVAVVAYCRTGIAQGAARRAQPDARHPDGGARAEATRSTRARIEAGEIEDVVIGCGLPEGATGHNIARNAALEAGFGDGVPGMTVNRYCGSGLTAASIVGEPDRDRRERRVVIAGGVESISLVQFNLNLNGFFYAAAAAAHAGGVVDDEPDRGLRREEVRHHARGAGRVRRRRASSASPRRATAGKFAEEIVPFTTKMKVTDKATRRDARAGGHARSRRGPASGHDARRPRGAEAGVSRRHDDRGQRLAAVRRRGAPW